MANDSADCIVHHLPTNSHFSHSIQYLITPHKSNIWFYHDIIYIVESSSDRHLCGNSISSCGIVFCYTVHPCSLHWNTLLHVSLADAFCCCWDNIKLILHCASVCAVMVALASTKWKWKGIFVWHCNRWSWTTTYTQEEECLHTQGRT